MVGSSQRRNFWSVLKMSDSWVLIDHHHPDSWDMLGEEAEAGEEMLSSGEGMDVALENSLTEVVIDCTQSSQSTFHHRSGMVCQALPLGQELLAVDSL